MQPLPGRRQDRRRHGASRAWCFSCRWRDPPVHRRHEAVVAARPVRGQLRRSLTHALGAADLVDEAAGRRRARSSPEPAGPAVRGRRPLTGSSWSRSWSAPSVGVGSGAYARPGQPCLRRVQDRVMVGVDLPTDNGRPRAGAVRRGLPGLGDGDTCRGGAAACGRPVRRGRALAQLAGSRGAGLVAIARPRVVQLAGLLAGRHSAMAPWCRWSARPRAWCSARRTRPCSARPRPTCRSVSGVRRLRRSTRPRSAGRAAATAPSAWWPAARRGGGGPGPMEVVDRARAIAGRGLDGDRYADKAGTFTPADDAVARLRPHADRGRGARRPTPGPATRHARRNVVTRGIDLNALVGRRFRVGDVECLGQRLSEPCAHLEALTTQGRAARAHPPRRSARRHPDRRGDRAGRALVESLGHGAGFSPRRRTP